MLRLGLRAAKKMGETVRRANHALMVAPAVAVG